MSIKVVLLHLYWTHLPYPRYPDTIVFLLTSKFSKNIFIYLLALPVVVLAQKHIVFVNVLYTLQTWVLQPTSIIVCFTFWFH